MKAAHLALVIPTHALTRASFPFFEFGVYVVQLTHPQVKRTKLSSMLHTKAMIHQERILFFVLFCFKKQNKTVTPGLKQRTPELCPHQGVASKQFRVRGAVVPARKVPRETAHCGTRSPPCLEGSFT